MSGPRRRAVCDPAGPRWRAVRAEVLERDRRRCVFCGLAGADEVHHVIGVFRRPDLAYEPANLRAAHAACHREHHRRRVEGQAGWRRRNRGRR